MKGMCLRSKQEKKTGTGAWRIKKERRKDWIWIQGIWGEGRSLFFTFSHFFSPLHQTLPQSCSSPIHPLKSSFVEVALHLLTLQLDGCP